MSTDNDRRRRRVIEVRSHRAGCYHLTIDGRLWFEVEWSASRRAWRVQDAAGQCLTHVEHIHAQDVDAEAAVRLAKRMIRDGRMSTPEDAERQLQVRLQRDRLGEPMEFLQDKEPLGGPMEVLHSTTIIVDAPSPPRRPRRQ